jgi:pimeloyl-ACP methyl ester carboxylesterase
MPAKIMLSFFKRHRRLRRLVVVLIIILVLFVVVPYLIPLGTSLTGSAVYNLTSSYGKFLSIDGVNIYVEDEGTSLNQTIVFLHGFGGSTFSWRGNVPFFVSMGYRVVAIDMKGFGLSTKDLSSDYSHPTQAKIVGKVLDKLNIDRVVMVGHSMGTSVMLNFAHLYPQRILAMVSVDGAVNINKMSSFPAALLNFGPIQRTFRDFIGNYLTKQRFGSILKSAYYNKEIVTDEVLDGYYYRAISNDWTSSLIAMTRDMYKNTIGFPIESAKVPILVFWGENDTWVKRSDIEKWETKIPNASFQIIPGVGHLFMEEKPEIFNESVLKFIRSH